MGNVIQVRTNKVKTLSNQVRRAENTAASGRYRDAQAARAALRGQDTSSYGKGNIASTIGQVGQKISQQYHDPSTNDKSDSRRYEQRSKPQQQVRIAIFSCILTNSDSVIFRNYSGLATNCQQQRCCFSE